MSLVEDRQHLPIFLVYRTLRRSNDHERDLMPAQPLQLFVLSPSLSLSPPRAASILSRFRRCTVQSITPVRLSSCPPPPAPQRWARWCTSQAQTTKTSTSSPEKRRRRAKDADTAAAATARVANYHVSMATDCVLVAAAAVITRLVSSQLARKQVNGAYASSQCAPRRRVTGTGSFYCEQHRCRRSSPGYDQVENIEPC